MLGGKTINEANEGSNIYNAGRDIKINDFSELLPILKELMALNINQSQLLIEKKMENLEKYMELLEKSLKLQEKRIDFVEKSSEPDSMELLLDSMKKASLKGKKIDQATLASMVVTRLGTKENLTQLIYERAYDVLKSIAPLQIKQIGTLYFFQVAIWGSIEKTEEGIERFYERMEDNLNLSLSGNTLNYLSGLGVLNWTPGFGNGNKDFNKMHITRYNVDCKDTQKPFLKKYLEKYNEIHGESIRLTSIGEVIGIEYFRSLGMNMNFVTYGEE